MVGHTEYFVVRDVIYKYLPPTVHRTDRISRDIIKYTAYLMQVLQMNVIISLGREAFTMSIISIKPNIYSIIRDLSSDNVPLIISPK